MGVDVSQEANKSLNSIIPDIIVKALHLQNGGTFGSELGGADHVGDLKTIGASSAYNGTSNERGGVVQGRENKVDIDYDTEAKKTDREVHGTPAGQIGPVQQQLREYGHKGRVLGPAIGCYGGASSDVRKLRDLAATELAQKHGEYYSMDFPRAKAMFKQRINREWGHHIARGWATLLLDRLRDYVGADGGPPTGAEALGDSLGPDAGVANTQWAHNNRYGQSVSHIHRHRDRGD
jgi:hypothetical protein